LIVIAAGTFSIAVSISPAIGQAAGVDVDAYVATRTPHVFARFQSPDALFKILAALSTLKFDHVGINVRHRKSFVSRG
jgi:hypothetical protein